MGGDAEFAMMASHRGGAGVPVDHSVRVGISFGLTSGVITTLGLLVGLSAGTSSRIAVLGGVFTIAVADSLSDALGIHVSEEAEGVHSQREVWIATVATFGSKLGMALTFAVPVILLDLDAAVVVSILWGALALSLLSWNLARSQGVKAGPVVAEHLVVAAVVITASYLVGRWISSVFS
jgi:VIT1/CCC1 family predicted Fe2+/Mn2+ transporter